MVEINWEGKYKDGKKVAPVRIALPFQTIETVNESTADRMRSLDMFAQLAKQNTDWKNRLIWGDKKYVLPSLLPEFAGKVNLIYIDPPFDTGANFSFTATIPDNPETGDDEETQFVKEPSIIEQKAYRDTWGRGLDSYLQWFYETAILLRELLAEDGSIYVHLDDNIGHYCKCILDEVFGNDYFKSEIIWKCTSAHANTTSRYDMVHQVIFLYTKNEKYIWNQQYTSYDEEYVETYYRYKDEKGRKFKSTDLTGRSNPIYEWKGIKRPWAYAKSSLDKLESEGKIFWTKNGIPRLKQYLDEMPGVPVSTIWTDINPIRSWFSETVTYATQKPESLLERIIKTSSNEGDLVLDCFCGSGTTAATAEKLNRRWITCDLGRFSIHTARKRFLGIKNVRPFLVQNLGKYERQQWMQAEFENPENRLHQERSYKHFINELYHAQTIDGYTWLHGSKVGRMIHVGTVETPVTVEDIKSTILEFWKLVGKDKNAQTNGIDFLGWDFAFDVNETAKRFAAENKVDVKFKKIPREVLEKKAIEQGDIKFYELASLTVNSTVEKKRLSLSLENFIVPPDDIPEEVRGSITHWSQWIDYWAIDWDYKDDTFHNQWQSYRTKQNPKIELKASNVYSQSGKYTVLVKVIDILGNDTTKVLTIEA